MTEDEAHSGDRRLPSDIESAEALIESVEAHAEQIKHQELETAKRRFDAHGPMTEAHERVLEEMADRLIDGLLEQPKRGIEKAAETDTDTTIPAAADLLVREH